MRVLITNNTLDVRAGTELYVLDVATELLRRGHEPICYSTRLGDVAMQLKEAGVTVVNSVSHVPAKPDVIHGHHHLETLTALAAFPDVPALAFAHGIVPWEEAVTSFPRVYRYVAVSDAASEHVVKHCAVPPDKVEVFFNFFDEARYKPKAEIRSKPLRAVAFGNAFSEEHALPEIREACGRMGLALDVYGIASGNICERPEEILPNYDIVFAKGRAAIEACAVGTCVVLTDGLRMGPAVLPENLEALRRRNFGPTVMPSALAAAGFVEEIQRYSAEAILQVRARIRSEATLAAAVDRLIALYEAAIADGTKSNFVHEQRSIAEYLERWAPKYKKWADCDAWMHRCLYAEDMWRKTAALANGVQLRLQEVHDTVHDIASEKLALASELKRMNDLYELVNREAEAESERLNRELEKLRQEQERMKAAAIDASHEAERYKAETIAELDCLCKQLDAERTESFNRGLHLQIIYDSYSWRMIQPFTQSPIGRFLARSLPAKRRSLLKQDLQKECAETYDILRGFENE
jgi:hypothetical protein